MLQVCDVHTYYGENYVIKGISLDVKKGSVVTLLGRNGMGKTTTIRTIIGFSPPRKGSVRFKGEEISKLRPFQIARMGVGLVPQGKRIFQSLSVAENLMMSERNVNKPGAWCLERIYSLFPILKERAKMRAYLLSGGEQQMLCIGRALMTNPHLLLMDEPSEGLSVGFVQQVKNIINLLKTSGISILLVEQNLPLALSVADYSYIISKGQNVYDATPLDLNKNEEVKTKYLGVGETER